jgi:hypothetical protein
VAYDVFVDVLCDAGLADLACREVFSMFDIGNNGTITSLHELIMGEYTTCTGCYYVKNALMNVASVCVVYRCR